MSPASTTRSAAKRLAESPDPRASAKRPNTRSTNESPTIPITITQPEDDDWEVLTRKTGAKEANADNHKEVKTVHSDHPKDKRKPAAKPPTVNTTMLNADETEHDDKEETTPATTQWHNPTRTMTQSSNLARRHPGPPVSWSNPQGDLTINDLEMAGLLLQHLALEQLVPLKHEHVAAWCDNTSAVSWAQRMTSSKSRIGHRLVRALMMRINPLVTVSIQGFRNAMADVASRSFGPGSKTLSTTFDTPNLSFLQSFNAEFPLEQNASWQLFRLSSKLSSLVFSELQTQPQSMDSWRRPTRKGNVIGVPGPNFASTVTWTPSSEMLTQQPPSTPCRPLLNSSDVEASAEGGKLALKLFKSRHVPSAHALNWLQNRTHATKTASPPNAGKP
jgi:hypothetical protein